MVTLNVTLILSAKLSYFSSQREDSVFRKAYKIVVSWRVLECCCYERFCPSLALDSRSCCTLPSKHNNFQAWLTNQHAAQSYVKEQCFSCGAQLSPNTLVLIRLRASSSWTALSMIIFPIQC